jgi:biotin carboxyl carrier protein
MSDAYFKEDEIRTQTRRMLQLMNQYSLMEVEYEDKQGEGSLTIRRDSQESSPPLLEGRTDALPGQVRASTVGRIEWEAQEDDEVGRGEVVAKIMKQDEQIPVKAPRGGTLTDVTESNAVAFGDTIARVTKPSVDQNEDEEQ